jgi:hypothetical protein
MCYLWKNILLNLNGVKFYHKILPKQIGLFWDKNQLNTTLENREFGHNGCSATSRFSLAGSLLKEICWYESFTLIFVLQSSTLGQWVLLALLEVSVLGGR